MNDLCCVVVILLLILVIGILLWLLFKRMKCCGREEIHSDSIKAYANRMSGGADILTSLSWESILEYASETENEELLAWIVNDIPCADRFEFDEKRYISDPEGIAKAIRAAVDIIHQNQGITVADCAGAIATGIVNVMDVSCDIGYILDTANYIVENILTPARVGIANAIVANIVPAANVFLQEAGIPEEAWFNGENIASVVCDNSGNLLDAIINSITEYNQDIIRNDLKYNDPKQWNPETVTTIMVFQIVNKCLLAAERIVADYHFTGIIENFTEITEDIRGIIETTANRLAHRIEGGAQYIAENLDISDRNDLAQQIRNSINATIYNSNEEQGDLGAAVNISEAILGAAANISEAILGAAANISAAISTQVTLSPLETIRMVVSTAANNIAAGFAGFLTGTIDEASENAIKSHYYPDLWHDIFTLVTDPSDYTLLNILLTPFSDIMRLNGDDFNLMRWYEVNLVSSKYINEFIDDNNIAECAIAIIGAIETANVVDIDAVYGVFENTYQKEMYSENEVGPICTRYIEEALKAATFSASIQTAINDSSSMIGPAANYLSIDPFAGGNLTIGDHADAIIAIVDNTIAGFNPNDITFSDQIVMLVTNGLYNSLSEEQPPVEAYGENYENIWKCAADAIANGVGSTMLSKSIC